MMLDDETLMAYADGEHEKAAEIKAALASRPTLAARVNEMRALRKRVADAFAPIAHETPPSYLTAILMAPRVVPAVIKRTPVFALAAFATAAAVALIALVATGKIGAASSKSPSSTASNDGMFGPDFLPPFVTLTPRGAILTRPETAPPRARTVKPVYADAVWRLRPDAETIERHYPLGAKAQNISGKVVLDCRVNMDGSIDCVIDSEGPAGWGFGAAAMEVARHFLLAEKAANGMPAADGRITIPIVFAPRNCVASPSAITFEVSASAITSAPALAPAPARVVENPIWVRKPDTHALARLFPAKAQKWGKRGHVVVRCLIALDGSLTNCIVTNETPVGWGFGDAALKMAQQFKMGPQTVNGEPTAGGFIDVPITFAREN